MGHRIDDGQRRVGHQSGSVEIDAVVAAGEVIARNRLLWRQFREGRHERGKARPPGGWPSTLAVVLFVERLGFWRPAMLGRSSTRGNRPSSAPITRMDPADVFDVTRTEPCYQ